MKTTHRSEPGVSRWVIFLPRVDARGRSANAWNRPSRVVPTRTNPRAAFTLVEIMVVVVIIGLLAAIAIPAFMRSRERSQAARLINDFRQFDSAFQRFELETGGLPPLATAGGVIPAGMAGYLPTAYTQPSPVGGLYVWSGPSAHVVLVNSNATDSMMLLVDKALDDGDLTTGAFVKVGATAYGYGIQ
jgi:prepilin-type N-terminal cleavage/methylation domain-containing protein